MSSVLSYRFNSSSKVWLQFPFEGGSITPNEFKRAVMKKLIPNAPSDKDTPGEQAGNVLQDFELQVFNDQTGEEYYGDMMSIPKNTQLVVKRVPNYRTKTLRLEAGGKQAAQDALEGYGTNTGVRLSSSAFDLPPSKRLNFGPGASVDEFGEDPLDESTYLQREEERRAQVAKERAAQLAAAIATATAKAAEAAQALATTPNAPTPSTMHAPMVAPGVRPPPSRPPPPGYICHNCRQGGHWKQLCPTAAHLSAPKVSMPLVQQATTGNVLSLLGLATRAPGAAAAILSAYTNRGVTNPSVTVAPNGSVIVTPTTAPVVAPLPAPPQPPQPTIPSDLTCTICHRLFTQPMVVPCCFTSFCEECIKQALVMDPSCPRCRSTDVSADQLRKNNVLARRAEQERNKLNQSQSTPQPLPQQPAMSHAAHYPPPQKMATFDGDDYSVQRR